MRTLLLTLLIGSTFVFACRNSLENTAVAEANLAGQPLAEAGKEPGNTNEPVANRLFKSTDGGQTWQDVSAELPGSTPVGCFLQYNGEVLFGADEGLFEAEEGLYRRPAASTEVAWQKELLFSGQIWDIFPGQSGIYAYAQKEGLLQNVSGNLWVPVFNNLKDQRFRMIFEAADKTLFFGCDNGIFKSTDQGKSWKQVYANGWVIEMVESEGVLLCTNQQGILRSTDGGEHWDVVVRDGGVGISVAVVQGGFASISYNTESETRRVRISEDGGKTWQAIDAGLPPTAYVASIAQVGEYLVCGHPNGVFRSADRGKTWQLVLPAIGKKVFNLSVSGKVMYAIPRNQGC